MPISPATTLPIFTASLAANVIVGPSSIQMATGLSLGLFQYLNSGVIITSIDSGTLGVGVGTGPGIILAQPVLLAALTASMAGHVIAGPMMPMLANAIALGVFTSLGMAVVQTINPLVGVGVGKLQLTPNGTSNIIFPAAFLAAGMVGPMSPALGSAIGMALDAVIASAVSVIAIAGPPSVSPSVGIGSGVIV